MPVSADVSQMKGLAKRVKAASPDTFSKMRQALKDAGQIVRDAAYANTDSVKVRKTLRVTVAGGTTVSVSAGNAKSLLPKLLEGDGVAGTWRHPVFPHGERSDWGWAEQARHPYLHPALTETEDQVRQKITDAMVEATDEALG